MEDVAAEGSGREAETALAVRLRWTVVGSTRFTPTGAAQADSIKATAANTDRSKKDCIRWKARLPTPVYRRRRVMPQFSCRDPPCWLIANLGSIGQDGIVAGPG
jgi:hypothetical protein